LFNRTVTTNINSVADAICFRCVAADDLRFGINIEREYLRLRRKARQPDGVETLGATDVDYRVGITLNCVFYRRMQFFFVSTEQFGCNIAVSPRGFIEEHHAEIGAAEHLPTLSSQKKGCGFSSGKCRGKMHILR
jgi:hypothetical protein